MSKACVLVKSSVFASQQTWSNHAKCVFQGETVHFSYSDKIKRIILFEIVSFGQL